MAAFDIKSILGEQSQPAPGQRLDVVMIPIGSIAPNPKNRQIYVVGDLDGLKEDIRANGLRQPLEVVQDGSTYRLIGGERRWTAMSQLRDDGDNRFELIPCILRPAGSEDDELLSLITANSTARELTDGERLAQYEALKGVLERKKAVGEFSGRVRDKMVEITGMSAGALGRMNAISANCTDEVKQLLRDGATTLTKCYEASKLWESQQLGFIRNGWAAPIKQATKCAKEDVINALVKIAHDNGVDNATYYGLIEYHCQNTCGKTISTESGQWLIKTDVDGRCLSAYLLCGKNDAKYKAGISWVELNNAYRDLYHPEALETPPDDGIPAVGGGDKQDAIPGGTPDDAESPGSDTMKIKISDKARQMLRFENLLDYWHVTNDYIADMQLLEHSFDDGTKIQLLVDYGQELEPKYSPCCLIRRLDAEWNSIALDSGQDESGFNPRGWVQLYQYATMVIELIKPWAEKLVEMETSD